METDIEVNIHKLFWEFWQKRERLQNPNPV